MTEIDIEQFVRDLNAAWPEGRYDDLDAYYHPEAVLLPPEHPVIVGADAIVESYRDFGEMATLHGFEVTSVERFDFGTTTMCHMGFAIEYELPEGRFRDTGTEVYAIDRSAERPLIVWRAQLPDAKG